MMSNVGRDEAVEVISTSKRVESDVCGLVSCVCVMCGLVWMLPGNVRRYLACESILSG